MTYIEDGQDFCGRAIAKGGEQLALYDVPFSPIEIAVGLLSTEELAKKPAYLSRFRWFTQIHAYRMAGLRSGEVIGLPDAVCEPISEDFDGDPFWVSAGVALDAPVVIRLECSGCLITRLSIDGAHADTDPARAFELEFDADIFECSADVTCCAGLQQTLALLERH